DVARIAPEDRRQEHAEEDEGAAHRRRAALLEVRLRAVLPDDLADLLLLELADEPGREEEGEEHRRDGRGDGAEREVAEDVQPPEPFGPVAQWKEELVQHSGGSGGTGVGGEAAVRGGEGLDDALGADAPRRL